MTARPALRTPAQLAAAHAFPAGIWLDRSDALSAPVDPATVAAETAPAWVAACGTDAGAACRACARCGALLGEPCVTCSGKVTTRHRGRV